MRFLRGRKENNKPPNTSFHQQTIRSWRPILTPIPVVLLYTIIGIIFLGLGIALFIAWSDTPHTKSYQYNDVCPISNETCIIQFKIPEKLTKPVYIYYNLDNHWANYRLFVRSRSDWQLMGYKRDVADLSSCDPHRTKDNDNTDQDKVYLPCGQIPRNFFTDRYKMYDSNNRSISWTKHDIAWDEEYDHKFKNPPKDEPGIRVIDDWEDPDFIVWMRAPKFFFYIKLYGVIHHDLPKGTYYMHINSTWEVERFNSNKYFYLSSTSWIGGPNIGIAIAFICVGGTSFLLAILFLLKHILAPRPLGDHSGLNWFQKRTMPP